MSGDDMHGHYFRTKQAAAVALEYYGIRGEVKRLPGDMDNNFLLHNLENQDK